MRRSALSTSQFLWALILALSIPWTGSSINPHILEHQAENNRAHEALPPHLHEGVHFEAVPVENASPDCVVCMRSPAKGVVYAAARTEGPADTPPIGDHAAHEHIASFRLTGKVAARAPPSSCLNSI